MVNLHPVLGVHNSDLEVQRVSLLEELMYSAECRSHNNFKDAVQIILYYLTYGTV